MLSRPQSVYLFYVFDHIIEASDPRSLSEGMKIEVFTPSWKRIRINSYTSILLYWFWFLFSRKKYNIYYLVHQGRIVHLSHVISKNPKFAFMGPEDFEIGPCWTHPDYRGQGIYSVVLSRIAGDFQGKADRLFIFAENENVASLKGISRSGFKFLGSGKKSGIFGIYRITSLGSEDPAGEDS